MHAVPPPTAHVALTKPASRPLGSAALQLCSSWSAVEGLAGHSARGSYHPEAKSPRLGEARQFAQSEPAPARWLGLLPLRHTFYLDVASRTSGRPAPVSDPIPVHDARAATLPAFHSVVGQKHQDGLRMGPVRWPAPSVLVGWVGGEWHGLHGPLNMLQQDVASASPPEQQQHLHWQCAAQQNSHDPPSLPPYVPPPLPLQHLCTSHRHQEERRGGQADQENRLPDGIQERPLPHLPHGCRRQGPVRQVL